MTTDKTIEEMNRAIAEFMGFKKKPGALPHYEVPKGEDLKYKAFTLHIKNLKYHEDWNQLMAVVEKIESTHDDFHGYFGVHINSNGCTIQGTNLRTDPANLHTAYHHEVVHDTKILATHKAIYDFIQWFNTTTKQKD